MPWECRDREEVFSTASTLRAAHGLIERLVAENAAQAVELAALRTRTTPPAGTDLALVRNIINDPYGAGGAPIIAALLTHAYLSGGTDD